jgi:hypothetical protein
MACGDEYGFPFFGQPMHVIDYGQYRSPAFRPLTWAPMPAADAVMLVPDDHAQRLHDGDIERIAQRVAEILREAGRE